VSASGLAAALELPRTRVINDLLAVARGLTRLAPADFVVLQAGHLPAGSADEDAAAAAVPASEGTHAVVLYGAATAAAEDMLRG